MARYAIEMSIDRLDAPLVLSRRRRWFKRPDELDTVVHAINNLRVRLKQDIEVRKRAEAALRAEKTFSETVLETLPGIVFMYDAGGRLVRWNNNHYLMFGLDNDTIAGRHYLEWFAPAEKPRVESAMKRLMEEGAEVTLEAATLMPDGRQIPILNVARRVILDGEPYALGLAFDLSEIKALENTIRESETRYRIVAEHTYDWEYWTDPGGRFVYCSPSCLRISGWTSAQFMADPDLLSRIIHPDDRGRFDAHTREDLERRNPGRLEFCIVRADGETRWVEHTCQPVFENERHLGTRASNRDITDRKRMEADQEKLEARLRQSQKMEAIGTLAGGIAHDFNNILGGILGYAELAHERLPKGHERLDKYITRIIKGGRRARDLVRQILTLSRKTEQQFGPVCLESLTKEALKLLRSTLPASIAIHHRIEPDLDPIRADATQIHQVIMNLCTNAAHAMEPAGGILEIGISRVQISPEDLMDPLETAGGPFQMLTVHDSGGGMQPEILDKIFDPYFTTKKPGEGTGLGLAVVLGIIKSHRGFIRVESTPGAGSIFSVYFPDENPLPDIQEESGGEMPADGKERILLVDDEEVLTDLHTEVLADLGYQVTTATDGEAAIRLLKANPAGFDLLITDMTMPRMSGLDLIGHVRAISPNLRTVLCTGFSKLVSKEAIKAHGIQKLLIKPVSGRLMAETVREILDGRSEGGE